MELQQHAEAFRREGLAVASLSYDSVALLHDFAGRKSIAYPMLSIGYVVNAIAAWYLLGEAVTPMRLVGIGIIVFGVFIVARS